MKNRLDIHSFRLYFTIIMKKTLQDIADITGYSVTTISRVFNGSAAVAAETKAEILNCARQIGYPRDRRTVMLILSELSMGFYQRIIVAELLTQLRFMNFRMEMIATDSIDLIEEHNLCGVISLVAEKGLEHYWGSRYALPMVCINTPPHHFEGIFKVSSNDKQGMSQLTNHLLDLGHRRIGLLADAPQLDGTNDTGMQRSEEFRRIMHEHSLPADLVVTRHWDAGEIYMEVQQLLALNVTAIIVMNIGYSIQVLHALKLMGKQVPQDISLAGWLDPAIDAYCDPPITGVMQNFNYIAKHAVIMLNRLIHKEPVTEDVFVDCNFFPRSSTAAPPGS